MNGLTQDIWAMEWYNRIHEWKTWLGLVFAILPRDNPSWVENNFYCSCLISVHFSQHSNDREGKRIGHPGWQGKLTAVRMKLREVPEKDSLKPSCRRVSVLSSCQQSEVLWLNIWVREMFWTYIISVLGRGYGIGEDCVHAQWDCLAGFLSGDFQHYFLNNEEEIHKFGCFLWHSLELMSYISDIVHTPVFSTFVLFQVVTGRHMYRTLAAILGVWDKLHGSPTLVFLFTHHASKCLISVIKLIW